MNRLNSTIGKGLITVIVRRQKQDTIGLNIASVWVVGLDQLPELSEAKKWKGLASVVMVKRERQLWNKRTTEVCF